MASFMVVAFALIAPAHTMSISSNVQNGINYPKVQVAHNLKTTKRDFESLSRKPDQNKIENEPDQLTSLNSPDIRPGLTFHEDGETSFRVWAPHANKVTLQVRKLSSEFLFLQHLLNREEDFRSTWTKKLRFRCFGMETPGLPAAQRTFSYLEPHTAW